MKTDFWQRIPSWILNAGWIGQGLALALERMVDFIKNDGYAIALFVGACVSIWGLWRKNKLQIRREEIELRRSEKAFQQDEIHAKEIHEIRKERERKERNND